MNKIVLRIKVNYGILFTLEENFWDLKLDRKTMKKFVNCEKESQ